MFKKLELTTENDVDMEKVDKFFGEAFDNQISAQHYKAAAQKCYEEITANFKKIQEKYEAAPFGLKKNECNVKFMAMMTCVEFQTFLVKCHENL